MNTINHHFSCLQLKHRILTRAIKFVAHTLHCFLVHEDKRELSAIDQLTFFKDFSRTIYEFFQDF